MPVRSINLRLVIPRSPEAASPRQALWTTHAEVNAAARYYEEHLLWLRAESYEMAPLNGHEEIRKVSRDEAEAAAVAIGREAQRINLAGPDSTAITDRGQDDEILSALQALYRQIVPTETGAASAKNAKGFLSPLTDPLSQGFGAAAEKLGRLPPDWLSITDDDPALLDAASSWLASAASTAWQSDTGSPAGWLQAARLGRPGWPQLFRRYLEQLTRGVAEGAEAVVAQARALGLLPLFPPYFSQKMAKAGRRVTPWDRLAFRLAVAHLLSWEAWCRRAKEQHAERLARLQEYRRGSVTPEVEQLLEVVRTHERTRAVDLSRLGLGPATYTIRPRQLRGWPELREAWLKSSRTTEQLRALSARQQTRKRGRFGDAQIFMWLAEPAQHELWTGTADVVSIAATLNGMRALVDRSRETATMTVPDAQLHPRAVQWAAKGDSNLRPYRIVLGADGRLHAKLRLLRARPDDGKLEDIETEFLLASSGQFQSPTFTPRGEKDAVAFANAAGEDFTGAIGSGDLLFDRGHLQRADVRQLERGDIGRVWLKLALDLDPKLPAGWTRDHARFGRHFRTALGTKSKAENELREGARVLSIDLGLRTLAACSVFALRHSCPKHALGFPVALATGTLWAVHERSFHLTLSGEEPSQTGAQWRQVRDEEMRRIRRAFGRYRRIMRLGDTAIPDRIAPLAELRAAADDDAFPFEAALLAKLGVRSSAPQPVWTAAVTQALAAFRAQMGAVVRDWRQRGREPEAFARAGKSMWAIQHLTDLRRTLQSWSLLGRTTGEIRRSNRKARGIFAGHLLAHLDHVKEDRLKTGADLVVKAALGYARDAAGRWHQRYAPCDLVLFEDLTRYRMRTDRPRRENSLLMQWAHRAMPAEVEMQGELYGIEVADTSAAFSSRYHARTLTPGIRCQPLSAADLKDTWLQEQLAERGVVLEDFRAGDLVPREGGQIFVCLRRNGGLTCIDADINAAQNLHRRYWTRHADAFRLPCLPSRLNGAQVWMPRAMGKRLLGALGGWGFLQPTGHETGSCRWVPATRRQLGPVAVAADAAEAGATDTEAEEIAGLAEEANMQAGKVEVFFRDPSGSILSADLWYPGRVFWGVVSSRTTAALKRAVGLPATAV